MRSMIKGTSQVGRRPMKKPFYQLPQWHDLIRQFTPNWFTVCMGTGIVSMVLAELQGLHAWFWQLGAGLWQLNLILFALFSALYGLRWVLYPQEAKQIFQHSSMSLFLGTIPMALATLINGSLKFGLVLYGTAVVGIAEWLWYIDVGLALLVAFVVPFCMFSCQRHQLQNMTAVWLLPIVACEVAAASGAVLLAHLPASPHAVNILFGSYLLWGVSVFPAVLILGILFLRLALHQLPSQELAMTGWLAVGPIGTGALALLLLGQQAPHVLQALHFSGLGEFLHQAGLVGSLLLLGFGMWWLGMAMLMTLKHVGAQLSFNLGWWGMTFPLGVFCLATLQLAQQLQLNGLQNIGYGLATLLLLLWGLVMSKTVAGFYAGRLFFSPCLNLYLQQK